MYQKRCNKKDVSKDVWKLNIKIDKNHLELR